jgi:hypothetical protein
LHRSAVTAHSIYLTNSDVLDFIIGLFSSAEQGNST